MIQAVVRQSYWSLPTTGIAACLLLLPFRSAEAARLTGHFTGTAFNSQIFIPPSGTGNFDGGTISGSFALDLTNCFISPGPGPSTGGCIEALSSLTAILPAPGLITTFGAPLTLTQATTTDSGQTLGITFGYTAPYGDAELMLAGAPDAFLTGANYASLHAGAVDLGRSSLLLRGGRSYATQVALTSFTFDGDPTTSVPEPSTWALMLCGFAMTGAALRRIDRTLARSGQKPQPSA